MGFEIKLSNGKEGCSFCYGTIGAGNHFLVIPHYEYKTYQTACNECMKSIKKSINSGKKSAIPYLDIHCENGSRFYDLTSNDGQISDMSFEDHAISIGLIDNGQDHDKKGWKKVNLQVVEYYALKFNYEHVKDRELCPHTIMTVGEYRKWSSEGICPW